MIKPLIYGILIGSILASFVTVPLNYFVPMDVQTGITVDLLIGMAFGIAATMYTMERWG